MFREQQMYQYDPGSPFTVHDALDSHADGCFALLAGESIDASQRGGSRRNAAFARTSVVGIWQINQVFNGLLLAGAADGSVRVWRDYTFPRTQRLATAWQVSTPAVMKNALPCHRSDLQQI